MIRWIKKIINKRKADNLARIQADYDAHIKAINYIKSENLADYTQSIKNSMYIRSSINVTTSVIHSIKGRNGAETKRRKAFLQNRIDWLSSKLIEEEYMVNYYGSLVNY